MVLLTPEERDRAAIAQATLGEVQAATDAFVAKKKQTIASNFNIWVECLFPDEEYLGHGKSKRKPEVWQ